MFIPGEVLLVLLVALGVVSRTYLLVAASSILLTVRVLQLDRLLPLIEQRGLDLGLLFLLMAVLVPFAQEHVDLKAIGVTFLSWPGVLAIVGGILATVLNGGGLTMLQRTPDLIVGIVVGSIVGMVVFHGIPVGPLMAAAITALLLQVVSFFQR